MNIAAMRAMPSVDEVLRSPVARAIAENIGHGRAVEMVRNAIEISRTQLNGDVGRDTATEVVERNLASLIRQRERQRLTRVINATGVIIHTNLGRSPLSKAAVDAVAETAAGYCNVELDLETGERGRRGLSAESLLAEAAFAEDGLIVNNCAAAALLTLAALAEGGEVIVSRGELVEIGGDFRIPDVLERSGCRLREVGTTNRTKISDYERAISDTTKAILRVHPSNYRITGFTEKPDLKNLAALCKKHDLALVEDAGSGALLDLTAFGLGDEPVISELIAAGADIVTFSGDKLVGGVQAGLIAGRRDLIEKIRRHPLYRAVRADKLAYAAVEATLRSFSRDSALDEIPTLRMLSMTADEIETRANELKARFDERTHENVQVELVSGFSAIGGGTGAGVQLPTRLLAVKASNHSADEIASHFRNCSPPIITRIADDMVVADLRTITAGDEAIFLEALCQLAAIHSPKRTHA